MSHSSKHLRLPPNGGNPRVGLLGGTIVGAGLLGFFMYLNRNHDRKVELDRAGKSNGISSWETRMMNRSNDGNPPNTTVLPASRVETRSTPLPDVKSEHNAHHRTYSDERALAAENPSAVPPKGVYEVPTAQRDGQNGFVYTKAPDWYEKGGRKPSNGTEDAA